MSSEEETKQRGGRRPGRRANKERRAELYDNLLYDDYFAPEPIFDACDFLSGLPYEEAFVFRFARSYH